MCRNVRPGAPGKRGSSSRGACARFETGSSTRLQRAREPPWLQRRIDFPIVVSGRPGIRCRMPRRYIGCCPSDYEHVDELVDWRRLHAFLIPAQLQDGLARFLRKAAGEVPAEFLFEQGNAFVAAAAMAQRILYRHLASPGSVLEENLQLVCDRALPGIEIIARVALVLDADHLGAQRVDARVGGDGVLVVGGA